MRPCDLDEGHTLTKTPSVARAVYVVLGLLCVGLGAAGAVLPVLPTTPFLILALAMFAKSSARLERWLLEHPRYGPRLVAWRRDRVIPLPVKLTAYASMIVSLAIMALTTRNWKVVASAAAVMAIGVAYVATRPSNPPDPSPEPTRGLGPRP